ncbi:hypothetical protein ACOCJ5_01815 [Knoellia sp. CPCC 206450]|uniref:hypothetical protein n=1 Tax=Knoellia tibetensis TaxID=3404798 RepID=UPI003B430597
MGVEEEFAAAEGELRGAERQMDRAMGSYLREVSEMREALHQFRLELEEEREDPKAQAEQKEVEREIRAGRHGQGLKELQERIDLDQTTLADVLSGRDGQWSADALRDIFGRRVDEVLAEEGDDGETDARQDAPRTADDGPRPGSAGGGFPTSDDRASGEDTDGTGRQRPLHEGGTW